MMPKPHSTPRARPAFAPVMTLVAAMAAASGGWAGALQTVTDEARAQRLLIHFDGEAFSGPGYERLREEGARANFFLVGEEHGIAENPLLAAQLFRDLAPVGYRRLSIEISPPMAAVLDQALVKGGLDGLRALYAMPGGEPAFFGMREEAQMLSAVRAAVPAEEPALWGADYEVAGDRTLLRELSRLDPPASARPALEALTAASEAAWARWAETANPQFIFTFSGDPRLVRALRDTWPDPPVEADSILHTLEETLEINGLWTSGQGHASNVRRGALIRRNFLDHWQVLPEDEPPPRVMVKFGASHLVRGLNMTNTWDLGSLIPELSVIEGLRSVSVLVLPGVGSSVAQLDPTRWRYVEAPAKDGYARGLEPLIQAVDEQRFTLIPLEPLRSRIMASSTDAHPNLERVAGGFDYLLVFSGSTASGEFDHP